MSNDDFKPRLGRIRDDGAKGIRHSTRVIGEELSAMPPAPCGATATSTRTRIVAGSRTARSRRRVSRPAPGA